LPCEFEKPWVLRGLWYLNITNNCPSCVSKFWYTIWLIYVYNFLRKAKTYAIKIIICKWSIKSAHIGIKAFYFLEYTHNTSHYKIRPKKHTRISILWNFTTCIETIILKLIISIHWYWVYSINVMHFHTGNIWYTNGSIRSKYLLYAEQYSCKNWGIVALWLNPN
jgi:hypothetical protein